MKRVMHRWYWAWSFTEEEEWLNAMARRGLALTDVGFCRYVFEEGKGDYIYRLELLKHYPQHVESREYIRFVEGTGAEYVGAVTRWAYFRRPAAMGPFQLYTDNESRLQYMRRVMTVLLPLLICNMGCFINNLAVYIAARSAVLLACSLLSLTVTAALSYGIWKVWRVIRDIRQSGMLYE